MLFLRLETIGTSETIFLLLILSIPAAIIYLVYRASKSNRKDRE